MILSVHQPQYLPWLGYLDKIQRSDVFVFLDNVQYKKREFQNRNKIRTKEGSIWLTVPVITKDRYYQNIAAVEINNETDWATEHLKGLELNYAKAKYFKEYHPALRSIYERKWEKLIDINIKIINLLLQTFSIQTPVSFESNLKINTTSSQRIVDICKELKADTYLSGVGAKDYLDEELFKKHNIKLTYQSFKHPEYAQNFEGFHYPMCALDYLLNCGPKLLG